MDENIETIDNEYTAKDLAKDAGVAVAQTAAAYAIAIGGLLVVGFVYSKIQDRKAKKKSQIEE